MSLLYYANLLVSANRIEAFRRGIEEGVRPGDRVLEIGSGLGTFAFFAARAGAGSVVAVDSEPVIHVAETVALGNGLADRVEFVRGSLPEVELSGKFDVVIYEDFRTHLLDMKTFGMLRDVQERSMAEGARMIPGAARLGVAPVHAESVHLETFPLEVTGYDRFGLDWSMIRPFLANSPRRVSLTPDHLLGDAAYGPRLPLKPVPQADDLRVAGSWIVEDGGVACALALWFELELHDDGWLSNAPREDAEPWGQWLLPVDPPLVLSPGQKLEASVWRESVADGAPGFTAWECRVGDEVRRGHEFAGTPLGLQDLVPDGRDEH